MRRAARSNSLFVVRFKQCPRSNLRFHLRELRKVIVDLNFLQSSPVCSEALVEGNGITFWVLCRKKVHYTSAVVFKSQVKREKYNFWQDDEPSSWKWKEESSNQFALSHLWIEADYA